MLRPDAWLMRLLRWQALCPEQRIEDAIELNDGPLGSGGDRSAGDLDGVS